eukprot:CAMPEP_0116908058 /NCGR_PEP_ID=MMETSP0467-20121206/13471_1 /TAXON_ID=283647 /ORGANISM="Mesodinium pulex, Strain SPMC105" /LENGTH=87 /DNA_ID=CAMNT_0004583187 /DNA_START=80 /DNA_END=343 /DNA_ORIENTATION=+
MVSLDKPDMYVPPMERNDHFADSNRGTSMKALNSIDRETMNQHAGDPMNADLASNSSNNNLSQSQQQANNDNDNDNGAHFVDFNGTY